ncbi:MAG: collagen-like protein [Bacteroidota bacterium]
MKKLKLNLSVFSVLVICLALSISAFAQSPHLMSYQAVVRNASGNLVTFANVGVRISILQGTATGAVVFEETQSVVTNGNGLASLAIGNGTNVSGSIATIAWTTGPFFIKTETDPAGGTNYSVTSTTQLMSVPYSLYAETSGSSIPGPKGDQGVTGTQGPAGPIGPQGPAGSGGMPVNCLECHNHNPATATPLSHALENAKYEYAFSAHSAGAELSMGEGGSAGCAPCHANDGFHSVVDNNTIPTYTLNAATGKYSYSYNATAAASSSLTTMPTKISCFTCHKGNAADSMALYTTAPIQMCMYPLGSPTPKIINVTQHNGQSNLCLKCHQPRPLATSTTLSNGQSLDYSALAANPSALFYDSAVGNAAPNKIVPARGTGNHYGTIGAMFSGSGAVEFPGSVSYANTSTHPNAASCQTCHMATPTGENGGHSFSVSRYDDAGAKTWNFKGCLTSGCHTSMSASSTTLTGTQSNTLTLLNTLSDKLRSGGFEIMRKNTDILTNRWYYVTPEKYDGTLDFYDPSANPNGALRTIVPSTSWTTAQKAYNLTLPKFTSLSNLQMGAIINFQLVLRDYSAGVHNPAYTNAVLNNTINALTDAGF